MLRLPRNLHMEVHKSATARASNGAWRFTKCCACHEFCTWRFTKCCACHEICTWRFTKVPQPEPLTEHGGSQSAAPATNSAHGGSQSAAPATNSARQETSEYSNHNGGTDRRPPTDNATARATNGAWRFTKCCACHEFCTWRFTKSCACHDFCTWRLITMEGRTGDHRRQPQTTTDNATARASNGAWRFTKCCACHEFCTSRNK